VPRFVAKIGDGFSYWLPALAINSGNYILTIENRFLDVIEFVGEKISFTTIISRVFVIVG
jgi:hypothetical protein